MQLQDLGPSGVELAATEGAGCAFLHIGESFQGNFIQERVLLGPVLLRKGRMVLAQGAIELVEGCPMLEDCLLLRNLQILLVNAIYHLEGSPLSLYNWT